MQKRTPRSARALFESQVGAIAGIVRRIARRHRLSAQEADELESYVQWKMIENEYRILRRFRGKSSLTTYLMTVVSRLFLDFRTERWGKWRPSAKALRLGASAVELEVLIHRDGRTRTDAVEILCRGSRRRRSRDELWDLAAELPPRFPRRFEGLETVAEAAVAEEPGDAVADRERAASARAVESLLGQALGRLSSEDRRILRMRFFDGSTVAQIAAALALEQRPLYRRIGKSLAALRATLERRGVSRDQVGELLGWPQLKLEIELRPW